MWSQRPKRLPFVWGRAMRGDARLSDDASVRVSAVCMYMHSACHAHWLARPSRPQEPRVSEHDDQPAADAARREFAMRVGRSLRREALGNAQAELAVGCKRAQSP